MSSTRPFQLLVERVMSKELPTLFTWFLCQAPGPESKPGKERWVLKGSLPTMCLENGYLWLWKSRTTKPLSLRENPASPIPWELLSLHRLFHRGQSSSAVFFLQYIAVDVFFPKPFYEYGLFTKRIIREAAPITLSTTLLLGRYSESKCFNTSLHL